MINFFIVFCYFIMAYGLTNLLVNGRGPYDILLNFRDSAKIFVPGLGSMLDCMMCTSTNVGLVMSVIAMNAGVAFTPFTLIMPDQCWLLIMLLDMFATSGAVWLIDAIELFFERIGEKAVSDMETGQVLYGDPVDGVNKETTEYDGGVENSEHYGEDRI